MAEYRIFTNGVIHTLDVDGETVDTIVINDNTIVYVGPMSGADKYRHFSTEIVDLGGGHVVPGMTDAHCHLEMTAHVLHIWDDQRDLSDDQLLAWISNETQVRGKGEWIVCSVHHDYGFLGRDVLDSVSPDNPVVLRASMHKCQANSVALSASGIAEDSPSPAGTRLYRDSVGRLTGVMEEAFDLVAWPKADFTRLKEAIRKTALSVFSSTGITSIHELTMTRDGVRAFQELAAEGQLPLRVRLIYTTPPCPQALASPAQLAASGLRGGFGNDWVQIGGIKIFIDGWNDAQLRKEQNDLEPRDRGILTHTYQDLLSVVTSATKAGLQTWMHAGGDEAQRIALNIVEDVATMLPGVDHRIRIEHIFNELFDSGQLARLRQAGGIPVPTPSFLYEERTGRWNSWIPPEISRYPYKTLLDVGLRPPGNSDCTGLRLELSSPWMGIQCMVDRRARVGESIFPEEGVDVDAALKVYSQNGAYAGFLEDRIGKIAPGMWADFAVLSDDPYAILPEDLSTIHALRTVVGGRDVYNSSPVTADHSLPLGVPSTRVSDDWVTEVIARVVHELGVSA